MKKYIIEKLEINGYDRFIHIIDLLTQKRWCVSAFENSWYETNMKVGDIIEGELFVQYVNTIKKVVEDKQFKQKNANVTTVEAIVKILDCNKDDELLVQTAVGDHMMVKLEKKINIQIGDCVYIKGELALKISGNEF